ncbi:YheC/YheD family protein [Paenibacillus sp.]|uniref:YheC/YheD family endospore coat-associated protein n=1 Tax=Paenibacillus sp. TaxID=58172 RepID=UPI002D3E6902|nr:YheC/YheD family protein [Paenibacillus sp.]HZG83595.1 YheC/YheD family protein [Paenibacillus sp.]
MSKTKVRIKVASVRSGEPADDHAVWVSSSLLRKWGVEPNQSVNLRFGAFRSYVRVMPAAKTQYVRVGASLAASMGLSNGAQLRAAYRPSTQTLAIGPLIGVIMSRASPDESNRPFGDMTAFCRELVDAAKAEGAFVYFFPPSGIGSDRGTIQGWTYSNGWRRSDFPVPDVLHNRLTSRKLENLESVQQLFKEAKSRYGTQVFNEKYLDKTEVFAALRREVALHRYLPESHAFTGYDTLKAMAAKHRILFLKPIRGSLGKGIIRLVRHETGGYAAHFSEPTGTRRAMYPSLAKAYAVVSQRMKRQKFLIQQGLQLAAVDGRPIDFRALTQKGLTGEWGVTSIVGRIAGPNHFVSNLAKGGTIAPLKTAIARSNLPAGRKAAAAASLRKAAVEIAKGVDKTIDAHFGELGVDLAVDQGGRVWLLEVNSKPSKNDNTQLTTGKIRPSVKTLIQYARHLARL